MSLTKLYLGANNDGIYELFPPRESLVSDIPAGLGTGTSKSFFYGVSSSVLAPMFFSMNKKNPSHIAHYTVVYTNFN